MAGQHQKDYYANLYQTYGEYQQSGGTMPFKDWLKQIQKSFDSNTAGKYYDQIDEYFNKFSVLYEYLEKVSNKLGYKVKNSLDISKDISDRLVHIAQISGIQDISFLTQLFHIDELQDVISKLTTLSTEGYIFAGEQYGELPGHAAISEAIGVKVSNGTNKSTLETFLLDPNNASAFTKAMQSQGKIVLMPVRDNNGQIKDFNFGLKGSGRYKIRDVLLDITGGISEQLPINSQDPKAVSLLNAMLSGRKYDVIDSSGNIKETIDFATKSIGANQGNRAEAITQAIYANYGNTGELISGDILEEIALTQLTKVQQQDNGTQKRQFLIPATTSGLASEDFILPIFQQQTINAPVQYKVIGDSVRFTYGSMKGTQEINGWYAGRGLFYQIANKGLSQAYNTIIQNNQQAIFDARAQINTEVKTLFLNALSGLGMDISGLEDELVSSDDIANLIVDAISEFAML